MFPDAGVEGGELVSDFLAFPWTLAHLLTSSTWSAFPFTANDASRPWLSVRPTDSAEQVVQGETLPVLSTALHGASQFSWSVIPSWSHLPPHP